MGDTVDNIPGLPKIGRKKAQGILEGIDNDNLLTAVVESYASLYPGENWFEYLTEMAQLLWIQQKPGQMYTFDPELENLGMSRELHPEQAEYNMYD
jgi:5'-3' exonuclease